jgi:S-DNA-T family DNA segregation ATPase FtsK/SpoIIIE
MASRAQAPLWRDTMKAGARRSGALIGGFVVFGAVVLLSLALASYHAQDPSLNTAAGGPARNLMGAPGAWIADLLFALLGAPVWLLMPVGLIAANRLWRDRPARGWGKMLRGATLGAVLFGAALAFVPFDSTLPAGRGGLAGLGIAALLRLGAESISDSVTALWIARGAALLLGGFGLWWWWRSLDFSLPQASWRIPRLPFAAPEAADLPSSLVDQLRAFSAVIGDVLPLGVLAAYLSGWVRLYGAVTIEVFGHLGFALDDAEPIFEAMLADMRRQLTTLPTG